MQATALDFGVLTAPGQRYHPVVMAQAAATLSEMFPERFWMAVGSGENINEHVTGEAWPAKSERNERLKECAQVMRALWRGEWVTHEGRVRVEEARLYSLPKKPPLLLGTAITPKTAEWMGGWADGLVTMNKPFEVLHEIAESFRRGGGFGKPMFLQVKVACGKDREKALKEAHEQWKTNIFESSLLADARAPETFESAAKHVRPEDMDGPVNVSPDPERHMEWMREYTRLGFERIYIHEVTRDQQAMLDLYGRDVIPSYAKETTNGRAVS